MASAIAIPRIVLGRVSQVRVKCYAQEHLTIDSEHEDTVRYVKELFFANWGSMIEVVLIRAPE